MAYDRGTVAMLMHDICGVAAASDRHNGAVIEGLKKEIAAKDAEIARLKNELKSKDETTPKEARDGGSDTMAAGRQGSTDASGAGNRPEPVGPEGAEPLPEG